MTVEQFDQIYMLAFVGVLAICFGLGFIGGQQR